MSAVSYDSSVSAVRFLRNLYQGEFQLPQRTFARHIAEVRMHEAPINNAAANLQAQTAVKNLSFWGIYHIIRKVDKLAKQKAVASAAPKAEPVRQSRGC